MEVLLDTQVLIWLESNPTQISIETRNIIFKAPNVYFSDVSIWEMAIKMSNQKLFLNDTLEVFINNLKLDYHFKILPILTSHVYKIQELEFHHRDPFDRLIIAQSLVENISLISSDSVFDSYLSNRIW